VVPWLTALMVSPPAPSMPRTFSMPARKPSAGLLGVDGVLVVTTSPLTSSIATTSVKVPPVSIPIRIRRDAMPSIQQRRRLARRRHILPTDPGSVVSTCQRRGAAFGCYSVGRSL
jgi:hypothetical protein